MRSKTVGMGPPLRRRASIYTPGKPPRPAEEWRERVGFANPRYNLPRHASTHVPFTGEDALPVGLPVSLGIEAGLGNAAALAPAQHVHPATIPEVASLPGDPALGLTVWDTSESLLKRWDGTEWTALGPLTVEEIDGVPSWPQTTVLQFAAGALDSTAETATVKPGAGLVVKETDGSPNVIGVGEIQINPGGLIKIDDNTVRLDYTPASLTYGSDIKYVQSTNSSGSTALAARSNHVHGLAHDYVNVPGNLPSLSGLPSGYIGGLEWCVSNDDWYSYRPYAFNLMGYINGGFDHIAPVNKLTGFAISIYYGTAICATYDGGVSWVKKQDDINTPDDFGSYECIAMWDTKNGLAGCQHRGGIVRTTDGWDTLTIVQNNPDLAKVYDICYQSANVVWACGEGGFVRRSTDGGVTWLLRGTLPGGADARKIAIPDPANGLNNTVVLVAASDGIYRSTDSGLTWSQVESSSLYYDIKFPTPLIGYATRYLYVKKTTDGGLTWVTAGTFLSSTCKALWCVSSDIVYVNTWGSTYLTTDGGAQWTKLPGSGTFEEFKGVPLGYVGTSPRKTIYGDEIWAEYYKKTSDGGWTGMHEVENVWKADAYFLDDVVITDTTDDLFLHIDPFNKSIAVGGYLYPDPYNYVLRLNLSPDKGKGIYIASENNEVSAVGVDTRLTAVGEGIGRSMISNLGLVISACNSTGQGGTYSVWAISYDIEMLDTDNTTAGSQYRYVSQNFDTRVGTAFFGSGDDLLYAVASNNYTYIEPSIYKPSGNMTMKCYGGSFYFMFNDWDIDSSVAFTSDSTMVGYYLQMYNSFNVSSFAPPVYGMRIEMHTNDYRSPALGVISYGVYADVAGYGVTNWSFYAVSGDWAAAADDMRFYMGAGQDASIRYDGTDLVVNPREQGNGVMYVHGPVRAMEYRSSDNSVGITGTFSWGTSPEQHTVTVKDGLIASWVVS